MRTKPPGITRQPSPSRASNSRRMNGRGTSWPFSHTGVVDSVTASCATKSTPRRPIASTSARARRAIEILAEHALARRYARAMSPEKAGAITRSSSRLSTSSRTSGSPSHQVATFGSDSSRPSSAGASAGRKLSMARASTTPEPSALAITTVPSRIACTRPGTPRRERALELERIGEIGIETAQQHLGALEAGHGADEDAIVADGQVLALDQQKAEIAREIGVLEIGLVQRPRRQHADAGIVAAVERRQFHLEGLEERRHALDAQARDRCRASRATAPAGSPAHSPRPTAPACDRRAPTSGRRANGRRRRHRSADARRPAARRRPADAGIPDCRRRPRPAAVRRARAWRGRRYRRGSPPAVRRAG